MNNYAAWVEQTYDIYPIGTAVGMPNGTLKIMGAEFQAYRLLSKQDAREIIVNSSQKLLSMINSESRLQKCLIIRPFELKNIIMKIFVKDTEGSCVCGPNIGIIRLNKGYLEYDTLNKSDDYVYKTEESHEESAENKKTLNNYKQVTYRITENLISYKSDDC